MRHLASLLAGMIAAPAAWLLIALGQEGFADARVPGGLAAPAAYVAGAGVLLGLVATLRISPLGPLVAGLLLLTAPVLLFVYGERTLDAIPDTIWLFTRSFEIQPEPPLANGTLLLVGAALTMSVFSAKRWRRWPAAAPPTVAPAEPPAAPEPVQIPVYAEPEPDYATHPVYQQPAYTSPMATARAAEPDVGSTSGPIPGQRKAPLDQPEPVYEPVLYEPPPVYRSRAAGRAGFAPAPVPEPAPESAPVPTPPATSSPVPTPIEPVFTTAENEPAPIPNQPTVSEIERESEVAPTRPVPKTPPTSPWAAPPGQR